MPFAAILFKNWQTGHFWYGRHWSRPVNGGPCSTTSAPEKEAAGRRVSAGA